MKISNMVGAYNYAVDLLNYTDGEIRELVQELCNQLKYRIEYGIKEVPEELIKKAEGIVYKVRVNS